MSTKAKHKHLLKTWYFWVFLASPLVIGATLMVAITQAEPKMTACFTSACVQTFFNTFKFPMAIMGSSLPLVAMIASIHRSLEANHQINLVSAQYAENIKNNRFGNYLKHREGFDKIIQAVCVHDAKGKNFETNVDSTTLYGEVFPDSGYRNVDWNGEWSKAWLEKANSAAKTIVSEMKKTETNQFDAAVFFKAATILFHSIRITHDPFVSISLKGKTPILLPKHGDFGLSIMSGIANSFGVLIVIKSYLGENDFRDLLMGDWYMSTIKGLNDQQEKFAFDESEFQKKIKKSNPEMQQ